MSTTSTFRIREVAPAEYPAIADLHIASWRTAYRGIVKDRFLDETIYENRRAHWADTATWTIWGFVLAAEAPDGTLVGFIACWEDRASGFDVLLDNLHIHPDHRGGGLGRALVAAAAARIAQAGYRSLYLYCFRDNERARRFYRSIGGTVDEEGFDETFGEKLPHVRIVWPDAAALAALCGAPAAADRD